MAEVGIGVQKEGREMRGEKLRKREYLLDGRKKKQKEALLSVVLH